MIKHQNNPFLITPLVANRDVTESYTPPEVDELEEILKPLKRYSISIAFEQELDKAKAAIRSSIAAAKPEKMQVLGIKLDEPSLSVERARRMGFAAAIDQFTAELKRKGLL